MGVIYSIGHSNRSIEVFISILHSFEIDTLTDIRSLPASKYCPQFNKAEFSAMLQKTGIVYMHMPELGGKREGGFRPYMGMPEFDVAIGQLESTARGKRLAYMCAGADWKHCHRSLVSGHLYEKNWQVIHIKGMEQSERHIAHTKQGKLF